MQILSFSRFLSLRRILILVSQIVFFCEYVSLWIEVGSQGSLVSTVHKLKYYSWICVVKLLVQMGLMLLVAFSHCYCKRKELLSWNRGLIEEIIWVWNGLSKRRLLRRSSVGKLPLGLCPDPQSISHPKPIEEYFYTTWVSYPVLYNNFW